MDLDSQTVADAMGKPVSVSGGGDHLSCGLIDLPDGGAGGATLDGGPLSPEDRVVDLTLFNVDPTECDGSGDVGAVPFHDHTEVE